jgi:hypothetical protein
VLFRCSSCDAPLEAPSRLAGATVTCPACSRTVPVPVDVLHPDDGRGDDEAVMGFTCPFCEGKAVTPLRAVGLLAVCPCCGRAVQVPRLGYAVGPPGGPDTTGLTTHCPSCRLEVPRQAETCRNCGTSLPARGGGAEG